MTTMTSMNPEAPKFVDASSAAARYASFINEPKYQVANKFFDALSKEKLAEEARAEDLRRYNQEFGLKQAVANREQAKYDRELNTDKALLDYQNIIRGTSQGGILNNTEGMSLANEYQKLVGTAGEDKASEIINTKAQILAQQDAKRAQSNPIYVADKIQGLTINGDRYGSIDPSRLINMQTGIVNDYVKRGESLRDLNATEAYRNKSLALEREKMNQQLNKENEESKKFANYLKAVAENETQVLVPGSTSQGITNQGEINNYVNNLTASSNQYNQIVKDYMDKGELAIEPKYKTNPGSSIKIPVKDPITGEESVKKTLKGKELENYAHEQAFKQTLGNYDFSKAPQAQYGEIKVEDKYIPKTKDQLIEDRLNILMNSGLSARDMKSEYEKLVPTVVAPKTQKEALEIQKLQADITKKDAETKKVLADTVEGKKGNDIPKNIGQSTANTIGASDAAELLSQLDTIAKANNIPVANLYNIVEQANNRAIESGVFSDVSEEDHKNFIKNEIWRKYRIDAK